MASSTRYSNRVNWIACPSIRRTSEGALRYPEPETSPWSSSPSARAGTSSPCPGGAERGSGGADVSGPWTSVMGAGLLLDLGHLLGGRGRVARDVLRDDHVLIRD